jgi:osmotically-inducible protein OsmY
MLLSSIRFSSVSAIAIVGAMLPAVLSVSGCVVAVAGGGVAGYSMLASELPAAQQMRDVGIKAEIGQSWGLYNQDMVHLLKATVFDSEVLLTGHVPSEEWRAEAVKRAERVGGVKKVDDEIVVGPDTHFVDSARDTWITTRLRGELIGDPNIKSINYTITTDDSRVYVMGIARTQDELARVAEHARTIPEVRNVSTLVRVLPGPVAADQRPGGTAGGAPTSTASTAPGEEPAAAPRGDVKAEKLQ